MPSFFFNKQSRSTQHLRTATTKLSIFKPGEGKCQKNKKLSLKLAIQTFQILTNDDEVCIPSASSILLAVSLISLFELENETL